MGIRLLVRRGLVRARERGLVDAATATADYVTDYAAAGFRHPGYQDERVDTERRWELFEPHIDPDDASLLDIGCAEGALTEKFAERGLFSVGIDVNEIRLAAAMRRHRLDAGLSFMKFEVTPESVGRLPPTDVVLLLAVFHHWARAYGTAAAKEMLREVGRKTGKLFFEPPSHRVDDGAFDGGSDDMIEHYTAYLGHVFGDDVRITHLGTVPRKGGIDREQFLVETDDYAPR